MAIQPNGVAPYAPPKAVIDIITTYRDRDMRKPFDVGVLMQAGVSESLAPRTLQALKILDIIDSEGNPTPIFEKVVRSSEQEFRDGLADHFSQAYADVFSFADPATNDLGRLRDAFRGYSPRGQQERMITLFLGLLEFAGVDISAARASMRPKTEGPTKPKKPVSKKPQESVNRTPKNGRGGDGSKPDTTPLPASGVLFPGITEADLALMEESEIDAVWSALGQVAKARARAIKARDAKPSQDDPGEQI
jgi:Family of unknown function (DUF5343)